MNSLDTSTSIPYLSCTSKEMRGWNLSDIEKGSSAFIAVVISARYFRNSTKSAVCLVKPCIVKDHSIYQELTCCHCLMVVRSKLFLRINKLSISNYDSLRLLLWIAFYLLSDLISFVAFSKQHTSVFPGFEIAPSLTWTVPWFVY